MEAWSRLDRSDVSPADPSGINDLVIAQGDISNYLYKLIIPKFIGEYFCLPPLSRADLAFAFDGVLPGELAGFLDSFTGRAF